MEIRVALRKREAHDQKGLIFLIVERSLMTNKLRDRKISTEVQRNKKFSKRAE